MTRKRNKKPATPRALRQMRERTPDDVRSVQGPAESPPGTVPIARLGYWLSGPCSLGTDRLAAIIESRPGVVYFLDSTQFIARTEERIWEALLADRRIAMTPPVFEELQWWLDDPKENKLVHQAIRASQNGDETVPIIWFDIESPLMRDTCEYYVNLLGLRKRMYDIAGEKLEEELGRKATNQEISNHCQQVGTSRAQLLGRQGRDAKMQEHVYHDEQLVVMAVMFAIITGREVTLISSDEAILDQFYKLTWLVDTHYRSMLMADRYAVDPFAFPFQRASNPHKEGFLDDQLLLLRKPSNTLHELLPEYHTIVLINCLLIQGEVTQLTFAAEREISRLLEVKAKTKGLSTDRLDGRNCHVFLGDRLVSAIGNWAAIGTDMASTLPSGMKMGVVDMDLALLASEHTTQLRVVDPNTLIPLVKPPPLAVRIDKALPFRAWV